MAVAEEDVHHMEVAVAASWDGVDYQPRVLLERIPIQPVAVAEELEEIVVVPDLPVPQPRGWTRNPERVLKLYVIDGMVRHLIVSVNNKINNSINLKYRCQTTSSKEVGFAQMNSIGLPRLLQFWFYSFQKNRTNQR